MLEPSLFDRLWALAACDTLLVSTELSFGRSTGDAHPGGNGSVDGNAHALSSPMRRLAQLPRTTVVTDSSGAGSVVDTEGSGGTGGATRTEIEASGLCRIRAHAGTRPRHDAADALTIGFGARSARPANVDLELPNPDAAASVLELLHTLRRGAHMQQTSA